MAISRDCEKREISSFFHTLFATFVLMNITRVSIVLFSPTGTSRKVAMAVADGCRYESRVVDATYRTPENLHFESNELVIVAVPVYGGKVAPTALQRLDAMRGNNTPIVPIVVYGNRAYDGALAQLKQAAQQAGFSVCGGVAALAQHSLIPDVAADRPDENDVKQLKEFAQKVQAMAAEGTLKSDVSLPGKLPAGSNSLPVHPKATKDCAKCGLCAEKCPAKAIPMDNPQLTQNNRCITCMRCVEICPNGARQLMPKIMKIAGPIMKKVWGKHTENEFYL